MVLIILYTIINICTLYYIVTVNLLLIFQSRLVTAVQIVVGGHVFASGLATYFGNETWYEKYLMPAIFRLTGPETGHRLAVKAAHYGLLPRAKSVSHPELVSVVPACLTQ